ncbi:hypothetical protein TVAG_454320 [Trichomonas vaginalis G3]|uniref:Viral A-type inclusion protein n=1 Tax=Trichomonas vaginalis (strain ATCC PRA-98 / G3) TaxID=412133 RepID=A2EU45_TRIV3|nr:hypothetical protein TVAGG3_0230950 [Trichomonas vaginalis G3]EAY03793.1 hypothetical protein TVAG_454320 [Trichomonas vaginalis G3]KAI5552622.1 hypothetical protein TVAGG3_0230950 [Trichomonas vaginalis G3]|eukprot:XP_001316016.1 hypothetical protein [Trichomonas vaginalis G3]
MQTVTGGRNPETEMLKMKLQTRDEEIQKLHSLFEELSTQFSLQANELHQETEARENLVIAIHKLNQMNQYLSDQFKVISANYSNAKNENIQLKGQIDNLKPTVQLVEDMKNLESAILDILPVETQKIIKPIIENSEKTYPFRVIETISALSEYYNNCQNSPSEAQTSSSPSNIYNQQKMLEIISANLRFINSLIDSKEKAQWLIKPFNFDDYRKVLMEQSSRITSYMKENNITPVDEKTLFDSLLLDIDPIQSQSDISQYLEQLSPENMSEGELTLFHLLAQAISANFALRKYSNECRNQCAHQVSEIKQLRFDLANNRDQNRYQNDDEVIELENKLDAEREENQKLLLKIKSLKNMLIKAQAKNNLDNFEEMIQTIDGCEECSDHSKSVIDALEGKALELDQARELCNTLEKEKQSIQNELNSLKQDKSKSEPDYLTRINELKISISELTTEATQTTQKMKEALAKKEDENAELQQKLLELEENDEKIRSNVNALDNEIKKLRKEKKSIEESYSDYKEAAAATLTKIIEKSKVRIAKMKQEKEKFAGEVKNLEEKLVDLHDYSEKAISQKSQKIEELNSMISNLQSEVTQSKSSISSLKVENKLLSTKLNGTEERLKREISIAESQYKVKVMSIETEYQSQLDKQKSQLEKQIQDFIDFICEKFNENITENMTIESAEELLATVDVKLRNTINIQHELDDANRQLLTIRKLFNAAKSDTIIGVVQSQIEKYESLKRAHDDVVAKNKAMKRDVIEARALGDTNRQNKEWEEWARKLASIVTGGCSGYQSPKSLRFGVEEAVLAAIGNKNAWMRLDILRAEKKILKSGHNLEKKSSQNFTSTLAVVRAVTRLQKLSGHAQSYLAVDLPQCASKSQSNTKESEKKPLFNSI